MSGKYQVVHGEVSTSSTTQNITASAGFGDVCCVMFYYTGSVTTGFITRNHMSGCGASDFTRQWVGVGFSEDDVGQTNCTTFGSTTSCIMFPNSTGTALEFGATASQINDGIQLNWGQVPSIKYKFATIFFGGSSLNCEVGTKLTDGSLVNTTHTVTLTDMTVAPEVLIFHDNGKNAFSTTLTADNETSWGLAAVSGGVVTESCYGFGDDDGRNAGGRRGAFTGNNYCMKIGAYAGSRTGYSLCSVDVTTAPASGTFTLVKLDVGNTQSYGYVALSWEGQGNYNVGIPNLGVNSTGITSPPNAPGFRPQFLLAFGSNLQTINNNATGVIGGVGGVQIIDSVNNNEGAYQWGTDEVDPSRCFSVFREQIVDMRDDVEAVQYRSQWDSFTDTTWQIDVSTASSNAKRWPVLVLGFVDVDDPPPAGEEIPLMWGRAF